MAEPDERYRVGYAITPKKEQSFIKKSLLDHAKIRGIDLDRIDITKPLDSQGPFDCIIHKVYGEDWKMQLKQYSSENPGVTIFDQPDLIERLHNRITMLEAVNELKFRNLGTPKQVVVSAMEDLLGPEALGELKFPVVAKPLVADGSATSHQMYLVFGEGGLRELSVPVVLQEFVNHGGVIFKVYVVGDSVTCVKRRSLGDISEEKLRTLEGALSFSQVSNLTAQDRDNSGNDSSDSDRLNVENAEMPPVGFIVDVANALREALGLQLFNFDVIKDAREENRYLVIDINYFPGFAKMPSYESVLTDFFWDVAQKRKRQVKNSGKELMHGGASNESKF